MSRRRTTAPYWKTEAMVYRNRKSAASFLIAGAAACAMAFLSHGKPQEPDEPKDGAASFYLFGAFLALVGLNGLAARIEVNADGLKRRSRFGLVKRFYRWDQLISWKLDQVPQDNEYSAGTWFVELEFPGEFHPEWIWIDERAIDGPAFSRFVEDVRGQVRAKERLGVHGTAIVS